MLSPEFLGIGGGSSSYRVANSLRFRASNSAYLSRTSGASPTDQKKVTYSAWMKAAPTLSSGSQVALVCTTGNAGMIAWNISGYGGRLFTRADANDVQFAWLARDPSAWFHLVVTIDTTQATASDRIKAWLNGVALVYQSGTYPTLNSNTTLNPASTAMRLMSDIVNGTYLDGHLAHVHLIDGQALTPSSFGKTDAVTGEWVPKAYSGTYGTNGFRLAFEDATTTTTIGADSSGNANNWTSSGISVTAGTTFDQSLDTPTLNFPVWSPIDKGTVTVSEGNTAAVPAADVHAIRATMAIPSSGKWYWEIAVSALGYGTGIGIADNASVNTTGPGSAATRTYQFGSWFNSFNSGVVQYGTSQAITSATNWSGASQPAANDIIMVAVDMDNGSMWVGKNGTWFNSSGTANPATNTDPRWTGLTGTTWFPYMAGYTTTAVTSRANFGQRPFAYSPPSGFSALNTANLAAPSIKRSRQYFDARLRTGTGAAASVSDLEFAPDLVWIKSRSAATDHGLYDAVRGVQKQLESNTTTAETTETTGLTAFGSNGYTVGALAQLNTNTATYVDWSWKESVTSGFDIVTYVGNGTNRTISHNLGAIPKLIIVRSREATSTGRWLVQHGTYGAARYAYLNETFAFDTANANLRWNSTDPTSSVFSLGTSSDGNHTGDNYVGYLFAEIAGFSRMNSYTGNGSSDGPFVWCGFRPSFVMIKRGDSTENWSVQDDARNSFNVVDARLKPNSADAEGIGSAQNVDFLANGFKIRNTDAEKNASGGTYIFAAFADVPFKYSRAR